jgi:hypothetical protein
MPKRVIERPSAHPKPMTTDTDSTPIMPLEETLPWLHKLRQHFSDRVKVQLANAESMPDQHDWWMEQARLEKLNILDPIESALHHLEAGKRKTPTGNFTKRTLKILNDIAEDVDCGESRKVLRDTIAEMAHEWEAITQQEHLKRMDKDHETLVKLQATLDRISTTTKEGNGE